MVYVRAKEIKGKRYYYLVKSKREGSRVRQITLKYLGSTHPDEETIMKLKNKYEKNLKN
ncbi:MAG: 2-C-methyl-D-erythritol 4-phosphate cytidylyltransferase [Candidatus Altiarchaeales archaeon]|nr:MAG: 2-C-methyl-D-erythritol 4-phosphate cytidylyltransferase [Candidatus Altiarchaeales archaeon]HDO82420.1 2-C-methyl-D-erythritol 4-phosphate cytidylyltransferase [Candidatus Altiarchaeales archaeon]HEX55069.1 2-C-methyl-D-erythritol 4-phosphate cytidylyltransferase [Candidatus Altiarchaeales archaeon]